MRILNWNIQQGGGTRIPQICRHIADVAPDLVVLSEFRLRSESALRAGLREAGLEFVVTSCPAPKQNGLLAASKWPLIASQSAAPEVDGERWLDLRIHELDLGVLALHIPGAPDNKFGDGYGVSGAKRKELMWERVLRYAADQRDSRAVIAGDFNTGLHIDAEGAMFKMSHYMQRLIDSGFIDTWRYQNPDVRGYTWYTKRKDKETGESSDYNGFRLDYIFASPPLRPAINETAILHAPRQSGASDHASVLLEVDVSEVRGPQREPAFRVQTRREPQLPEQPLAQSELQAQVTERGIATTSLQDEIAALLRRADCHYGNTLRDEEAGWTVAKAAVERNVRSDRIVELRAAVRRAILGEHSQTKAQVGHEDGVLRALLHFRGELSEGLRQHIDTRLARLKADFLPNLKVIPLQCKVRGSNQLKRQVSREEPCACGLTHAGECW